MSNYDELLDHALEKTPDIEGSGERFDLPEPDVRQEGNVTVYENFQATIDRLDRQQAVVLKFLQDELGTSAHIDEKGRARLTGAFSARRVGNAIEAFTKTYVRCPECGLPDTRLVEEQGATVIKCDACGALSPTG